MKDEIPSEKREKMIEAYATFMQAVFPLSQKYANDMTGLMGSEDKALFELIYCFGSITAVAEMSLHQGVSIEGDTDGEFMSKPFQIGYNEKNKEIRKLATEALKNKVNQMTGILQ
jgi:hypothetical protein